MTRERVQSGAIIDGYRVGECIHRGGTGSIYRVDRARRTRIRGFRW